MTRTITQNNALCRAQLNRLTAQIHRERRRLVRKIFWLTLRNALTQFRRALASTASPARTSRRVTREKQKEQINVHR